LESKNQNSASDAIAPLFVAVDQSTSATKALLFDATGTLLDREFAAHRQHYPQPGWVEHDAEEIWAHVRSTVGRLVERNRGRADAVGWISITNQRETFVVFERVTGRPLYPAIVWQCRRGDALCREHEAAGRGDWVRARTGLRLDTYFSGSKMQWLVRNRPDLRAKLASGEAVIGTIDAYLVHRLTGGTVWATDSTNASRTLLFDIVRLRWDEELCALWEVPIGALPEVRESSARFGETTAGGAFAHPVPICGVMGDSQASLYAHRCFSPGMAKVTFGMGASLLLNIGSTCRQSSRGVVTALAWVQRGVPTYAFEGIIISSAATLAWLRDQLGLFGNFSEAEGLALAVRDTEGVYLVPAFSGLGLPHWRPSARAAILGLSTHSDRRHVIRAGIESIAYQVWDALAAMQSETGTVLLRLHGDGGSTVNRFLMQFTADLAGVELRVAEMPECSALGAGLIARLGMAPVYAAGLPDAREPRETVYRPSPDSARAAQLHAGWTKAVRLALQDDDSALKSPASWG
jgi:glycerol kinase